MTAPHDRRYCGNCNETLPRAAAGRCPFCRTPLAMLDGGFAVFCRRCKSPISGTGKCPVCGMRGAHGPAFRGMRS